MAFEYFPYTNFHDLNLDWVLDVCKKAQESLKDFENFIVQSEGTDTTKTMSQDAVTNSLNGVRSSINTLSALTTGVVYSVDTTSGTVTCNVPYNTVQTLANKTNNRVIATINGAQMILRRQTNASPITWVTDTANENSFSMFYIIHYSNDTIEYVPYEHTISQTTGTDENALMSQAAITENLDSKVGKSQIVQATGASTTAVMSQKAVTDSLAQQGILQTFDSGDVASIASRDFTLTDMVPGTNATVVVDGSTSALMPNINVYVDGVLLNMNYNSATEKQGTVNITKASTLFNVTSIAGPATYRVRIVYSTTSQSYVSTASLTQSLTTETNTAASNYAISSNLNQSEVITPYHAVSNRVYGFRPAGIVNHEPIIFETSPTNLTVTIPDKTFYITYGSIRRLTQQTITYTRTDTSFLYVYYSLDSNKLDIRTPPISATIPTYKFILIAIVNGIGDVFCEGLYKVNNIEKNAKKGINIVKIPTYTTQSVEWTLDQSWILNPVYNATVTISGTFDTSASFDDCYAVVSSKTLAGKYNLSPIVTKFSSTASSLVLPLRCCPTETGTPPTTFSLDVILFYQNS